jgi:Fur family ferric uptake transcriptional regulator
VHDCPGDLAHLAPKGFSVERHELTLYGQCDECSFARKVSPAAKAQRHE